MIFIPGKTLALPPRALLVPLDYMDPVANIVSRLRGMFKLDVIRSDGSLKKSTGWFPNLITNAGLDAIGSTVGWLLYCHVGTGNTAPANTDTSLVTWLASSNGYQTQTGAANGISPYMANRTQTIRFAAGTATGNLSEVGMGPNIGNTGMFSRALILDGVGAATTITVLAAEALDVTYQLNNYPPLADVAGSVVLSGITYTTNMRAANAGATASWDLLGSAGIGQYGERGGCVTTNPMTTYSTQTLGAITAVPAGSSSGTAVAPTYLTYTASNYFVDTQVNFGLGDGNSSGGIGSAVISLGRAFGRFGNFQCSFTPVIPKDATKVMMMVVRHTWARYP